MYRPRSPSGVVRWENKLWSVVTTFEAEKESARFAKYLNACNPRRAPIRYKNSKGAVWLCTMSALARIRFSRSNRVRWRNSSAMGENRG